MLDHFFRLPFTAEFLSGFPTLEDVTMAMETSAFKMTVSATCGMTWQAFIKMMLLEKNGSIQNNDYHLYRLLFDKHTSFSFEADFSNANICHLQDDWVNPGG